MAYLTNGIQLIRGNLNSAALNAMHTTGQILVPAPGAGFVNVVIGNFFNMKVGSTPWTNPDFGNVWLIYGTTGNDQVNVASALLTNQLQTMAANTNYIFGTCAGIGSDWLGGGVYNSVKVLSSNAINKPISITCVNSIATPGNGNMDYTIFYAVLSAS